MKKIVALALFLSALSLWAQDSPHRLVEVGFDFGIAPFTGVNNYLGTVGVLMENAAPNWSGMAADLDTRLGAFFDTHERAYLNVNLGVNFKIGLFAGRNSLGQFSPSGDLDRGAASFMEAGLWFSTKIKRWALTVRPSYFVPLVYVRGAEIYTPLPLTPPGDTDLLSVFRKGGVDLTLRGEYPLLRNLLLGGTLTHVPILSAELREKYSITGDTPAGVSGSGNKVIFRPFKFGADAVYRPFYQRLFTLKPELALVFNTIYDTPVSFYADFALTGELNVKDLLIVDIGAHYEDLIWKQRVDLLLNFRAVEFAIGIGTQSPRFTETFQGVGFGVDLGVRMGF
jgi:hypothetical protein